jgi:putative transcriptional regulator
MEVRVRLLEMLQKRGRTIYWLSKQVGVDFTTMYRFRDGEAKGIRFALLAKMCKALDCEISDLLVLEDHQPPEKRPLRMPARKRS